MTRRRLQPIIDAVVPPLLAAGFEKRQWSLAAFSKKKRSKDDPIVASDGPAYTRRLNEDVLGVFIARTGTTWLGPIYGVRHEGIMRLLEDAGVDLDGDDALYKPKWTAELFKPTLTCYEQLLGRQLDKFLPNTRSEWTFRSKEDIDLYVPRVQAAIKRIVLPYMRRCRTLDGIVAEMRKNEKDPRAYVPIAAGLHLLGRNEEAIDFLARWPTVHSQIVYYDVSQEKMNRDRRRYASWLIDRMQASGFKVQQRRLKALEPLLRERKVGSSRTSR